MASLILYATRVKVVRLKKPLINAHARLDEVAMSSISIFLLPWLLIPVAHPRGPQETLFLDNLPFGSSCMSGSLHLGSYAESTQQGLVAQNLQYLANAYTESSIFYTLEYPYVKIRAVSTVCLSRGLIRNRYSTITLRVDYDCRGIACRQAPSAITDTRYIHLFSFACQVNGSEFATMDHFGMHPYINRSYDNSGFLSVYKCSLCSVAPSIRDSPDTGPRFHADTGCLGIIK